MTSMPTGCNTSYVYSRTELLTFATSHHATQPLNHSTWLTLCQCGLSVRGPTPRVNRADAHRDRGLNYLRKRGVNLNNLRPLNKSLHG